MDFHTSPYNEYSVLQAQNRIKRLNRILRANITAQNKLDQIYQQLKNRLKKLSEQAQKARLIMPSQLQIKLLQEKYHFRSMYEQQLIRGKWTIDNRGVLKKIMSKPKKQLMISSSIQKWGPNPHQINFFQLSSKSKSAGIKIYKKWYDYYFPQTIPQQLSLQQQSMLNQIYLKYGKNWQKLAGFFPNRHTQQVQKLSQQFLFKSQNKKARWTYRQNIKLLVLVQHIGEKKWAAIARKFPEKTDMKIRQRFCNILDPQLSTNSWSTFQINQLIRLAPIYDYKWSKMIASEELFKKKTDNALRRKYRNYFIGENDEDIIRKVGNQKQAQSIIRHKNSRLARRKKHQLIEQDDDKDEDV